MKLLIMLTTSLLTLANVPLAQASLVDYTVAALFTEPTAMAGATTFHGSFTWDTTTQTISNLQGTMNSSMYSTLENISLGGAGGLTTQITSGGSVVATAYKNNSAAIFAAPGAGQTQVGAFTFGLNMSGTKTVDLSTTNGSQNAFFTFAFNPLDPSLSNVSLMTYADCTGTGMGSGGLMGTTCMTGHMGSPTYPAAGTMGATPTTLNIQAVPIPAAIWLLGSALAGMSLVSRRKTC